MKSRTSSNYRDLSSTHEGKRQGRMITWQISGLWATVFLMLGLFLFVLLGCRPSATNGSLEAYVRQLDAKLPQSMDRYGVPGLAIALIDEGEVVWSNAYGYADIEQNQKMSTNSIFRVESISKSVTAWGVMRLVEQGHIDLDIPVETYLRSWKYPHANTLAQKITTRMLLSNSAGLSLGTIGEEYKPQSTMPTLRDFLTNEFALVADPGSSFLYSDTGFNILQLLVEEVTGRDFAEYMTSEVITPLNMPTASFEWKPSMQPRIPTGYDLSGKPVSTYVYPAQASGGLFATVEDIARFTRAELIHIQQEQEILTQKGIRALYTPQVAMNGAFAAVADAYGCGHFIEVLPDGRQAVWHGGQGHGWMSHFHIIPESGDGIVILTNSQRSWPLLAEILRDWAVWSGAKQVKFSRITQANHAFLGLTGVIFLLAVWQTYRLLRGIHQGSQCFAPFAFESSKRRFLQAIIGFSVLAALWWANAQPYLFVSSIFPDKTIWAALALIALSTSMIASALFAPREPDEI